MVYKSVRGWTSGRSLPVLDFVKYSPPPTPGILHKATHMRVLMSDTSVNVRQIDTDMF